MMRAESLDVLMCVAMVAMLAIALFHTVLMSWTAIIPWGSFFWCATLNINSDKGQRKE
jgi:hypothetical protein